MKPFVYGILFIIVATFVLIFASLAGAEEPSWKRILREQRSGKKVFVCHVVRYEFKKINGKYKSVPITVCKEK